MDKEIKREARKQYIHYFRIWFILIAVLLVVFLVMAGVDILSRTSSGRRNMQAPAERVYDYADVLTGEEEQKLREYIAQCEAEYEIDLVLVTINEDVESQGYWETVMMNIADNFYDENGFGYDKVHGDGALLLDNWYEDEYGSQAGSWLSTCGIVHDRLDNYEINRVLDEVYYRVEDNPYAAYKAYVQTTCEYASGNVLQASIPWWFILLGPAVIAVIYAVTHLVQSKAKDTTTAKTYVEGGKCVVTSSSDTFIRKSVSSRRIETSSGGSSGGHRSGGGGSHRSSSGVRHGGGGRRR
uniref:TPM domain-containing protein n=1 Tax=Acetatifactor sp. TaxID=1872090 RepID=UPI0040576608